jgi:DNA-binding NarL/FixJ family response regulator
LLDYDLDGEPGTVFLDQAREKGFKGHILLVTDGIPNRIVLRVFEQGVSGIFLKQARPEKLVEAIHTVLRGQIWLDPQVAKQLVEAVSRRADEQPPRSSLSVRELAVVKAVTDGLSNRQIAEMLRLSERSVKAVLQQIFARAGVHSRSQLVRFVMEDRSDDWLGRQAGIAKR